MGKEDYIYMTPIKQSKKLTTQSQNDMSIDIKAINTGYESHLRVNTGTAEKGKEGITNAGYDISDTSFMSPMSFCSSVGSPSSLASPFEIASPFYKHTTMMNSAGILPLETTNILIVKMSDRAYFEFLYVLYSYIVAIIGFLECFFIWITCVYVDNNFSTEANCYGNIVLFFLTFGFGIWFEFVESPPPLALKIGCWHLTIGYVCFGLPSLLTLLGESETFGFELYLAGSFVFTSGSLFYLLGLNSIKSFDLTTMFVVQHTAWWGSVQFLIGSIIFVIWSFGLEFPYGNSAWLFETTGQWLSFLGQTTFVFGRIHFLADAHVAMQSSWSNFLETEYIKRDHEIPLSSTIKIKDGPPPSSIHKRMSTFARKDGARVSYLQRGSALIQNDMNVIKFTSRKHSQLYIHKEMASSPVLSTAETTDFLDQDIVITGDFGMRTSTTARNIFEGEHGSCDETVALLSKPVLKYS